MKKIENLAKILFLFFAVVSIGLVTVSCSDDDDCCSECTTDIVEENILLMNYEDGDIYVRTYLSEYENRIVLINSCNGDNGMTKKYYICNESILKKLRKEINEKGLLYVNTKVNIRKINEEQIYINKDIINEVEIKEIKVL